MDRFQPTVPPAGRLVRLGIVLDAEGSWSRLIEVARMCDGAGIDALWVRDLPDRAAGAPLDAWTALCLSARDVPRASLGASVDIGLRSPTLLAAMARTVAAATGGRLEISLHETTDRERLDRYAATVRDLVSDSSADDPVKLSVPAPSSRFEIAAARADDVLLPPSDPSVARASVARVRAACEERGRDPATIGVAMQLPVSIGRTTAEARARAEADAGFDHRRGDAGDAATLFGTLEQCQERVIELAHAGVTDLRCLIPDAPDLPDVIAQLTAIAIGTTDVLRPGSPRSKAPDPPAKWGGRAIRSAPDRP